MGGFLTVFPLFYNTIQGASRQTEDSHAKLLNVKSKGQRPHPEIKGLEV